jgi:hypothetical protein
MGDVGRDARWGLKWGIGFSIALTLYATALYIVLGSEPFDRVGVPPGTTIGFYVVTSMTAGLVVALLRPLTRSRGGSMLVGTIAAIPGSFALNLTFFRAVSRWSMGDWFQFGLTAVMFGVALGYVFHRLGDPTGK